jgi:hypothetical protein
MLAKGRVNSAVFIEFRKRWMHNDSRPIFLILNGGATLNPDPPLLQ